MDDNEAVDKIKLDYRQGESVLRLTFTTRPIVESGSVPSTYVLGVQEPAEPYET